MSPMRSLAVGALLTGCSLVAGVDMADPRFAACGGTADNAEAAFPFVASDYHEHFPFMGRSPELEVEAPAFAVVFVEGHEVAHHRPFIRGALPPEPSTGRFVCVYVGIPPAGDRYVYARVDVAVMAP
jgi:hypothetical protein